MNLSELSVIELRELQNQIPLELKRREKEEKVKVMKEIAALAASHGYDSNDLMGNEPAKKPRAAVAIKYRHPQNPELTWTGRGRTPNWITAFTADGGTLEQLAV